MLPNMALGTEGSLTIYNQKDSPGKTLEANWLPGQTDFSSCNFAVTGRIRPFSAANGLRRSPSALSKEEHRSAFAIGVRI